MRFTIVIVNGCQKFTFVFFFVKTNSSYHKNKLRYPFYMVRFFITFVVSKHENSNFVYI